MKKSTTYVTTINESIVVVTTKDNEHDAFLTHMLEVNKAVHNRYNPDGLGLTQRDVARVNIPNIPFTTYLDGYYVSDGQFVLAYEPFVNEVYWEKKINGLDY